MIKINRKLFKTGASVRKKPLYLFLKRLDLLHHLHLVDGVVETHTTWAECERRVKGKPARYKKALTEAEEEEIIRDFTLQR